MLKWFTLVATAGMLSLGCGWESSQGENTMSENSKPSIVFATFAASTEELQHAFFLAESLRDFGGAMSEAPVRLYVPENIETPLADIEKMFEPVNAVVCVSQTPPEATWFFYADKVFAAGQAEKEVAELGGLLVWMDEDTIILREPSDLALAPEVSFAYRPVMHNRSGTLFGREPNPFWKRIYEVLEVKVESLFPVTTPADNQEINAYFNAGLLVVRPQKEILRNWGRDFEKLYRDSVLVAMCQESIDNRIFLHQTALVGAVLSHLKPDEMVELSGDYNYPLFFEQMFDADHEFWSIDGPATMRYDVYFRNPHPEWRSKLTGPDHQVKWLGDRLGKTGNI